MRNIALAIALILIGTGASLGETKNFNRGYVGIASVSVGTKCRNGYWYDIWVARPNGVTTQVSIDVKEHKNDKGKHKRCNLRKNYGKRLKRGESVIIK